MLRKYSILIIFLILLCSSVMGVPPFIQTSTSPSTMEIEYPKFENYPIRTNVTLHFHVTNSTGFMMDNETTICVLHFYNSTGSHISRKTLSYDDGDFEYKINKSFIKKEGTYTYIVNCNNSYQGGFISSSISFTKDGLDPIKPDLFSLVICQLILIGFYLFLGVINFADGKKDMDKFSFWFGFMSFGLALAEMMLLITFIHGAFFNIYTKNFIDLNLIINFITMFGLSMITYTRLAFIKSNFAEDKDKWE